MSKFRDIYCGEKYDDPWEKVMFLDVDVLIQVRFVPELERQRLKTCLFS